MKMNRILLQQKITFNISSAFLLFRIVLLKCFKIKCVFFSFLQPAYVVWRKGYVFSFVCLSTEGRVPYEMDKGVPPGSDTWRIVSFCNATGGAPLGVTMEDFLVVKNVYFIWFVYSIANA